MTNFGALVFLWTKKLWCVRLSKNIVVKGFSLLLLLIIIGMDRRQWTVLMRIHRLQRQIWFRNAETKALSSDTFTSNWNRLTVKHLLLLLSLSSKKQFAPKRSWTLVMLFGCSFVLLLYRLPLDGSASIRRRLVRIAARRNPRSGPIHHSVQVWHGPILPLQRRQLSLLQNNLLICLRIDIKFLIRHAWRVHLL